MAYNRYSQLKTVDGLLQQMPFVKIPELSSDRFIEWNLNSSRYDILSDTYYSDPQYGFLIEYANPQYMAEFDIMDNDRIRIPFPFKSALDRYENGLKSILNN